MLICRALRSRFKSRARLEAENLVLSQQLSVLIRKAPKPSRLTCVSTLGESTSAAYLPDSARPVMPIEFSVMTSRRPRRNSAAFSSRARTSATCGTGCSARTPIL